MSFMPAGYVWNRRNVAWFIHTITIGASGAISSQDAAADSGVVAAKASQAGRYTLTFPGKGFRKFQGAYTILIGDATNQFGAVSVGFDSLCRAEHIDDATNPPTVIVQFVNSSTNYTDADLPSGTVVKIHTCVEF